MPGLIPGVGDLLEVRNCCYTPTQIALNVTHWEVTAVTGGGVDLASISGQFDLDLNVPYKNWMSINANYRGFGIKNLAEPRTVEVAQIANDGPGSVAAAANLPTQTSGLIHIRTDMAGRKNRGRLYPGFPAGTVITLDGALTAAGAILINDIAVAYGLVKVVAVGANSTTIRLTVRHPDTGVGPLRVTHSTPASFITGGNDFATQRRRGQLGRTNVRPF